MKNKHTKRKDQAEQSKAEKKDRRNLKWKHFGMHITDNKGIFILYAVLRLLVLGVMIAQIFNKNYENVFLCILTLILFFVPSFIELNLKVDIPDALEGIILLFIFAAEILGEIRAYYITYPYWDTMLHTLNGFLAAAIGFSMTIGVIWEFFEFGMDLFFGLDMQKDTILNQITSVMLDPAGGNHPVRISGITSVAVNGQELGFSGYLDIGLFDTMKDLLVNFIGAVVFSVFGYFYVLHKGKGKLVNSLVPQVLTEKDFNMRLEELEQKEEEE